MGTVIEQVAVGESRWRHRHSALHLAVDTAQDCLRKAARHPHDVDLLVNAGIYRDRNLGGEPALAALIQEDIGAIPKTRMRARTEHSPSTSPTAHAACCPRCRSSTAFSRQRPSTVRWSWQATPIPAAV